jgi:hypothetical protein
MSTTTAYWLYTGVIQTNEGKPYINASITAEFEDGRIENLVTLANGVLNINYSEINGEIVLWDSQSKLIKLNIIPKENEYQPLELNNFVVTEVFTQNVDGDTNLYELGTIILVPPFQIQSKTLQDIEIINKTAPIKSARELPKPQPTTAEAKAANKSRKFVFDLAKRLPKYVLTLLAPFGPHLIKKALEGERGQELLKAAGACPSEEQLLVIIKLRNELTTILNKATKTISTTNDSITIFNTLLGVFNATLVVLKSIPYPSTGIPFLGLPPLTTGSINTFTTVVTKTQNNINKGQIGLKTVQSLLLILEGLLLSILELLSILDSLIQRCSEEKGISYDLINVELINIQGNVENSYKGFTFDIKLDTQQNPNYPRRYAVALNQDGLILLKSNSSFTSNPQTLIDELKLIIDRDNLKAY